MSISSRLVSSPTTSRATNNGARRSHGLCAERQQAPQPAIAGDTVVLNCDQDEGESYLLAVDARTGKTRWQTSRAGCIASYSTPIVWRRGAEEDVVVCGSLRVAVTSRAPARTRWTARVLHLSDRERRRRSSGRPALCDVARRAANAMGTFADFVGKNDKDGDGKISPSEAPPGFEGNMFSRHRTRQGRLHHGKRTGRR